MDFGFYTFIKEEVYQGFLKNTLFTAVTNLANQMATLLEKVTAVTTFLLGKEVDYLAEIADLRSQLAAALANDAADAAAIAEAQAAADAAITAATEAEADLFVANEALAADVAEDSQIAAALQPILDRIPSPPVDEEVPPIEEPVVEEPVVEEPVVEEPVVEPAPEPTPEA